jgi:hypothetical protein
MTSVPASEGRTLELADLAFGSQSHVADASRPLAWLSPDEMAIDLSDPVQRRFGDYELLEKIGQGGMGVVYRARQHGLERDVALKLLAAGPWASEEFVERFRREARSAARMQHPNIVEIYEFGHRDGLNYFSMRLIDGESLAQHLTASGPMAPRAAAVLLRTLAEAMDYAHRLGVLHLDLKPANVLLTTGGTPLIADFGLARRIDAGHEGGSEISGTPSYMAPEQAQLEAQPLSASTDIYGLGAVLYECLTGNAPFLGGSAQSVLERVLVESPVPPRKLRPDLPADLEAICLKCLEKDPARRYPSARAMADDLGRFIEARPVSVRPLGIVQRARRWRQREPRLAAALALAVAVLVAGVATTTWQWRQAVAQRNVAEEAKRRATAERDRAKVAGEIGAFLFANEAGAETHVERAQDLVSWLRKRWPGNEQLQADALTAFAASVGEAGSGGDTLLAATVQVLGADYRRQAIEALQAGTDPNRDLYSALLTWSEVGEESGRKRFLSYLRAAVAANPDDPLTLQVASVYCPSVGKQTECAIPDAANKLARVAPDNAYSWLLLSMASWDPASKRSALHEAAQREKLDDMLGATYTAYVRAFRVANVPVPPLLSQPLAVLAPGQGAQSSIADSEAHNFPIAVWQPMVNYCVPADLGSLPAPVRDDCRAASVRMARSSSGLITRMIGVAIATNVSRGTPLVEEMRAIRRQYAYLGSVDDKITTRQAMGYAQQYLDDVVKHGELMAMQRRVEFFGLPGQAPANWKPENPVTLITWRERIDQVSNAIDESESLLSHDDPTGALAALAPFEADIHTRLGARDAWMLSRYLVALGRANAGVAQFQAGEANLLEAWETARGFGPGSKFAEDCMRALIALYEARDKAEPGKGYAAKAVEWRQALAGN